MKQKRSGYRIIMQAVNFGRVKCIYIATLQIFAMLIFNLPSKNCLAAGIEDNAVSKSWYIEAFYKNYLFDSQPNKYIDTPHPSKLQLGGEARSRYERYWNDNWGGAAKDNNGYFLHRFLLHADVQFGDHLKIYAELKSAFHSDLDIASRPVDEDELDLQQLNLSYAIQFADSGSAELRLGRQQLTLGSNRLLDKREYTNALLSFDGFSFFIKKAKWQINTFGLLQSRMSFGIFDNKPDSDRKLWGIYSTKYQKGKQPGVLDLYYIGQNRRRISYTFGDFISFYNQGPYSETRHTLGLRFYNSIKGFDYDIEPMFQLGAYSKNNQTVRAYRLAATVGYTFPNISIKPRLYLNVDIASGDRDSSDRRMNTFLSPYPDILDPSTSNISGFKVGLNAVLKNKMSISIYEWLFWRTSTQDGIYGFLGLPYRAPGQSYKKFIGNCPVVNIAWPINKHINIAALYATQYVGGGFLRKQPPGADLTYAGLSFTYKFLTSSK